MSERDDRVVTVALDGDLVASSVERIKAEFKLLLGSNPSKVVVDMAKVTMIDSMGIGLLLAAYNSLKKTNGQVELIHVAGEINQLLSGMRLNRYLTIS